MPLAIRPGVSAVLKPKDEEKTTMKTKTNVKAGSGAALPGVTVTITSSSSDLTGAANLTVAGFN